MVKIVNTKEGDCHFELTSDAGSPLLKSVSYQNERQAKQILREAMVNPIFERRTNHQGKFVISLKTQKGNIIGQSQTYSSEAGMENGIKNLKKSLSATEF